MNIDLASPFTAVLSVSVALFATFSVGVDAVRGPTITGSAVYADTVTAGEVVQIPWTFHKRSECDGENSRVWSGAGGFHLTEAAKRNSLPTSDEPIRPVIPTRIPEWAPAGRLELHIVGECIRGQSRERFSLGPVVFNVTE